MTLEEQRHSEDSVVLSTITRLVVGEVDRLGKWHFGDVRHGRQHCPDTADAARKAGFGQKRVLGVDRAMEFQPHIATLADDFSPIRRIAVILIERETSVATQLLPPLLGVSN